MDSHSILLARSLCMSHTIPWRFISFRLHTRHFSHIGYMSANLFSFQGTARNCLRRCAAGFRAARLPSGPCFRLQAKNTTFYVALQSATCTICGTFYMALFVHFINCACKSLKSAQFRLIFAVFLIEN